MSSTPKNVRNLRIVADENIPFVNEFFSSLGEVYTYPGRTLSAADVASADVLLVRSVTPVNESLLSGSRVQFVGTCTIGTDHLDIAYLEQRKITYRSAPGCNANSVVEFVMSVLASLKPDWQKASFGVIGCGNVGGHLYRILKTLGLPVEAYDPFLSAESGLNLASLEEVLEADVVCLHTPYTTAGSYPTHHLLDETRLQKLSDGCLLINAGRGAAISNQSLKSVLRDRSDLRVALDVWEPEPALDVELMDQVDCATPHIAGYSFDGKVEGTSMIYHGLCEHLGIEPRVSSNQLLQDDPSNRIEINLNALCPEPSAVGTLINQAIQTAYAVLEDDQRTRAVLGQADSRGSATVRSKKFDELRKTYPKRREFHCAVITQLPQYLSDNEKKSLSNSLATLGFTLAIREES